MVHSTGHTVGAPTAKRQVSGLAPFTLLGGWLPWVSWDARGLRFLLVLVSGKVHRRRRKHFRLAVIIAWPGGASSRPKGAQEKKVVKG